MSSDPKAKRPSHPPPGAKKKAAEESDSPHAGERPTVIPPFDLGEYARETMPPSVPGQPPPAAARRTAMPAATADDEYDDLPVEMPAVIPHRVPRLRVDEASPLAPANISDAEDQPTVIPPRTAAHRPEAPTFTNELELEAARQQSEMSFSSHPPPHPSTVPAPEPAHTSVVSPHLPNVKRVSALSLADMRMPTPSPMNAVGHDDPVIEVTRKPARAALSGSKVPSGHTRVAPAPRPPESSQPPPSQMDPIVDMRDRFSLGDYSGALAVAEMILVKNASNSEAAKMAEECQRVLIKMYAARIGPLDRVPMVMVQPHELRWLSIDHRAGFLLSLVDGMSNIEMILDVSGMPLLDTLRILHELYQQRVISFRT